MSENQIYRCPYCHVWNGYAPELAEHVKSCSKRAATNVAMGASYPHSRYALLLSLVQSRIAELSKLKGGEYAGDEDRLANFRRNGEAMGLEPIQIWRVYAGKHWDAVSQFIRDIAEGKSRERMENIQGRLDDLIVYCILGKAILEERGEVIEGMALRSGYMVPETEPERSIPRYGNAHVTPVAGCACDDCLGLRTIVADAGQR